MTPDEAARLAALETDVAAIKKAMAENTRITEEGNKSIAELLELFGTAKGGLRVAMWLGNSLKWTATLAAAMIGAWLAIREAIGK